MENRDKHYLSWVIKVNINSESHVGSFYHQYDMMRMTLQLWFYSLKPQFEKHQSPLIEHFAEYLTSTQGLPCSSDGKESTCNTGDPGSIPGLWRSSEEGNGNPLQYSCLENPMNRGPWQATVCGVTKSRTWLVTDTTYQHSSKLSR